MERSMRVFSKVFVVLLLLVATDPTAADEPINASNWWDQINLSPIWYCICILAALFGFGMASFVSLVVLILIALRVPENDWATQKVFHCLNFAVNGEIGKMVAKARTCVSQSHRFKDPSVRKSNCASVCQTEGFHGGKCRGFRRRRFFTKHC